MEQEYKQTKYCYNEFIKKSYNFSSIEVGSRFNQSIYGSNGAFHVGTYNFRVKYRIFH